MRNALMIAAGLLVTGSLGCGGAARRAEAAKRDGAPAPAASTAAKVAELKTGAANKVAEGDFEGALADYRQAIKLDPKAGWAYVNAGNILAEKGDTAGGLKLMDEAIRQYPDRADYRRERGLVRHRTARSTDDLKAALNDLDLAVQFNPDLPRVYAQRAAVYKDFGDEEAIKWAVADLKTALEKSRSQAEANQIKKMLGELEALKTAAAAPAK